jgi:hypothetical protein
MFPLPLLLDDLPATVNTDILPHNAFIRRDRLFSLLLLSSQCRMMPADSWSPRPGFNDLVGRVPQIKSFGQGEECVIFDCRANVFKKGI